MVGLKSRHWFPQYFSGIAVAGFHLHFISDDLKYGGHVLDLKLNDGKMDLMQISDENIHLPNTNSYISTDLNDKNINADIDKAENTHHN